MADAPNIVTPLVLTDFIMLFHHGAQTTMSKRRDVCCLNCIHCHRTTLFHVQRFCFSFSAKYKQCEFTFICLLLVAVENGLIVFRNLKRVLSDFYDINVSQVYFFYLLLFSSP
uniref:Secreted protein n=1 Tax=Heterorhabditis bacteriophora TaxID=37862 RepID=A0A1I7WGN0_HETBA